MKDMGEKKTGLVLRRAMESQHIGGCTKWLKFVVAQEGYCGFCDLLGGTALKDLFVFYVCVKTLVLVGPIASV